MADDQGAGQAVQSPVAPEVADTAPHDIAKTSTSRRVRARLARRMTSQRSAVNPVLEPLVAVHREFFPKADLALMQRAYDVAEQRHADQMRRSGDPYITHPLAVANILAELGMDTTTLVAALLHDTVEDTGYTLEALKTEFGDEVGHLVDGVTKLDRVVLGTAAEGETIRKMIIAMARDPRVLVIKVADRLHNMRTMRFLPPEKQARKARETLEVIAPLAHRLGMATVKWELEDLAFAILHPKKYEEIVRLVADRAPSRDTYLAKVRSEISATLAKSKIAATVEGRPKHYWSIYQKMIVKGRDFDDIHDLVGIRILCDEIRDCYAAVGVVHSLWQPMAGRFKDYIAQPRYGVYQSLHTTVVGPEGKPLEVQIRTNDMHGTAEYGIAAHWRYKEAKGRNGTGRGRDRRDGVDASAARLAAGGRRPRRVPGVAALRPGRAGDLRVHSQGRCDHAADGIHAGGLRLRRAHRSRPSLHRREGQRSVGRAGTQTGKR
jgi:GTP diphosphokinase / guanosine-3',5'-bis(diphosphate) 3'-diphosphatase